MQTKVNPIPQGYNSITPYLIVKDAAQAIKFYTKAFGAKELNCLHTPDGMIAHCELQLGDSRFMMADESPDMKMTLLKEGTNPFSLLIYVDNVDEVFNRAVEAGSKIIRPLQNEFYGDRMGTIEDPFGHNWNLATHIEDVSDEEMRKRAEELWQKNSNT